MTHYKARRRKKERARRTRQSIDLANLLLFPGVPSMSPPSLPCRPNAYPGQGGVIGAHVDKKDVGGGGGCAIATLVNGIKRRAGQLLAPITRLVVSSVDPES